MSTTMEFDTLQQAYDWANAQINGGMSVQECRICQDRFKSCRPRGSNARLFKLLGATWGAEKVVKTIEPNGKWRIEVDEPGTEHQTQHNRFSLYYSRFLPYAVAMMMCESGFETDPICYTCVNCLYGTVGGFWELGLGDGHIESADYWRIDKADVELFSEVYHASMAAHSPSLPFDESFYPCVVYVALHTPKKVLDHFSEGHGILDHVREVCEAIGKPVPEGFECFA